MNGCDYVMHVASPLPKTEMKESDAELVEMAKGGTLRVLKYAKAVNVKRVVVTGSTAAVGFSANETKGLYSEDDWTVVESVESWYVKSKTLAEKAAWNFSKENGLEVCVVLPGLVIGPIIRSRDATGSVQVVQRLLSGNMPMAPKLSFALVDVRDVAALHILCMQSKDAAGERFICTGTSEATSMIKMSSVLIQAFPQYAKSLPTRQIPNFILKIVSYFDKSIAEVIPMTKMTISFKNDKALKLGWQPINENDSICATADALIELKVV